MNTTYPNITEAAQAARQQFELQHRDADDADYWRTVDDAPQWVVDLCKAAHDGGEILPDDYRYDWIVSALDCIIEAPSDVLDDDQLHEWADAEVPVYNSERIAWLASHGTRYAYCDQALSDGAFDMEVGSATISLIGCGMYREIEEVGVAVLRYLRERVTDA